MTKSQYLVDPDVNNFINWLGPFLDVGFTHTYTLPNGTLWSCSSIYDAFLNYNWGNNNFSTTAIKLSAIKRIYDYGVLTNDIEIIKCACDLVFSWGGVENGNSKYVNNYNPINFPNIQAELTAGILLFNQLTFDDDFPDNSIKLNSGFTKIYSLLRNDFIIYDSRVALALYYLIGKYTLANGLNDIPNLLIFRIPPRKGNIALRQIPQFLTNNGFIINGPNGANNYQISNMRANWILSEVLNRNPGSLFNTLAVELRLRALESALFMIGYD
jgi:hypothetical protein